MIQSKMKPDRIYIGSSNNIRKRWNEHRYGLRANRNVSPKLQRHFNKYGESDLVFSVITTCPPDQLAAQEQYFIDCYNPWFNIMPNARSAAGFKLSEEARGKISEANSRRPVSEETKEKMRMANTGKRHKPESCLKMSITRKGRTFSEEHKRKISEALKGKNFSPEHKANLREARHDRVITEETRLKMSEAKKGERNTFFGRKHTEETKMKIAFAASHISDDTRQRQSEAAKAREPIGEETRHKHRERMRLSNHLRWHANIPLCDCPICNKTQKAS
jgi:group I intron endonuclease